MSLGLVSFGGVKEVSEDSDFHRYRPAVTDVTVVQAASSWGLGDDILSLSGKRTAIDSFILLLARDLETLGPYLLNATCARALCTLLIAEGFGPKED